MIGKLRHEGQFRVSLSTLRSPNSILVLIANDALSLLYPAIFLNEHLTEALRRLQRDTSETNVDRRLVTNLLLQFLTTPRADAKRFEMLSLIASILSWNDEERETAGLQKVGGASNGKGVAGRKVGIGAQSSSKSVSAGGHGRAKALDGGAGDEVSCLFSSRLYTL